MSSQEPSRWDSRSENPGHAEQLPPMGWYPDPGGSEKERYWDGSRWTRNLRAPREVAAPAARHDRQSGRPETLDPLRTQGTHKVVRRRSADDPQPTAPAPRRQEPYPGGQYPSERSREALTSDGVPLAGWWWRVLATIIDMALVWVVVAIVMHGQFSTFMTRYMNLATQNLGSYNAIIQAVSGDQQLLAASMAITRGTIIGQIVYQFAMLAICSASVGQLVCRLRVVEVDHGQEHRRLRWWRALLRAAVWGAVEFVSQTTLGLLELFSYLMPLWQRRRQTIHDLVGGTQVIRLPRD
ncbi:RDD family protein [Acidipropionibacterium acidipropionici]|uniref:RDD family protein n=1 Tax=Acidipropionibacterium acidipropionici TaxID=1748 RepID=UPI002D21934C|nr:RDD family protein [Acidipropionibacterium acidipropionici]